VLGGWSASTSKVRADVEDDSEILFLPVYRMIDLGHIYPQWIEYLFRMYHRRFEELLDMVNAIAFQKMDERLWDLLLKKSELQKAHILNVTYEQLANELGTARVVVSGLLKELETESKLTFGRNKIRLIRI
jgi:CRP/FNR family transcriptional regulator